jgi:hypothetical protein
MVLLALLVSPARMVLVESLVSMVNLVRLASLVHLASLGAMVSLVKVESLESLAPMVTQGLLVRRVSLAMMVFPAFLASLARQALKDPQDHAAGLARLAFRETMVFPDRKASQASRVPMVHLVLLVHLVSLVLLALLVSPVRLVPKGLLVHLARSVQRDQQGQQDPKGEQARLVLKANQVSVEGPALLGPRVQSDQKDRLVGRGRLDRQANVTIARRQPKR